MAYEYATLRLLHLVFGILWAGGAITIGWFVIPAAREAGPAGAGVMRGVVARRFPIVMQVSGFLTVLVGLRLYHLRWSPSWVTTPEGFVLTLGGLLGLGALAIGVFAQAPTASKVAALAAQIAAQGGPPSPEQAQQMGALQARMGKLANVLAWHLLGATVLMAAMRLAQLMG